MSSALENVATEGGREYDKGGSQGTAHGMPRTRLIALVALSIVCGFSFARPWPAQEKPPSFRVTTRLVELTVVAIDKHGNAVMDLKKEDFEVFDNGKPRKISLHRGEDLRWQCEIPGIEAQNQVSAPADGSGPRPGPALPPPVETRRRYPHYAHSGARHHHGPDRHHRHTDAARRRKVAARRRVEAIAGRGSVHGRLGPLDHPDPKEMNSAEFHVFSWPTPLRRFFSLECQTP